MGHKEQSFSSLARSGYRINLAHKISVLLKNTPIKGAGWLRARLPHLIAPYPKDRIILLLKNGLRLIVDPVKDKGLETSLYYHGEYEDGIISIISSCLIDGQSFIDVGSNIGLISLAVSGKCCESEVYCFEPQPNTYQILLENIALNNSAQLHPFNFAIGSKESKGVIYSKLNISRGSATMIEASNSHNGKGEIEIKSLDDFISEHQLKDIGLIKIDVEGWEYEVIQGAQNLLTSIAPALCVEHNSLQLMKGGDSTALFNLILKMNKYKAFKLSKGKQVLSKLILIKNTSMLPINDNVFYFLPRHIDKLPKSMFK